MGEIAEIKKSSGALSRSHGWKAQSLDGAQHQLGLHNHLCSCGNEDCRSSLLHPCLKSHCFHEAPPQVCLRIFQSCKPSNTKATHSARCPIHIDIPAFLQPGWLAAGWGLLESCLTGVSCLLLARPCKAANFSLVHQAVSLEERSSSKSIWLLLPALGCREEFLFPVVT